MLYFLLMFLSMFQTVIAPGRGTGAVASSVVSCVSGACQDSFIGVAGTTINVHDANWRDYFSTVQAVNIALSGSGTAHCCSDGNAYHVGGGYYNSSTSDTSQLVILPYTDGAVSKIVCVRGDGVTTVGYCAQFGNASTGNWTKVSVFGPSYSTVIEGSWSQSINHTLKITASGTGTVGITITVDDTSLGTSTVTGSITDTGHPGFYITGDGNDADNYVGPWQDH